MTTPITQEELEEWINGINMSRFPLIAGLYALVKEWEPIVREACIIPWDNSEILQVRVAARNSLERFDAKTK